MNKSIRILLLAFFIVIVPFSHMQFYETAQPAQGIYNLKIMNSNNLARSLPNYPKVWPPLYPSLLWSLNKTTGLSAYSINVVLFSVALLLVGLFTRKYIDENNYFIPVGLLAINNVFCYNASVITSETLMMAQSLLLIFFIAKYIEQPKLLYAILLGVVTGVMCLTRYFGLIWAFPATVLCLVLSKESISGKIRHIIAYGLTSFVISASWIFHVLATTGHLTGMDRTGQRDVPGQFASLIEFVSFENNVVGTLKTATYDLLSPDHIGQYKPVLMMKLSIYEVFLSAIILSVFALTFVHVFQLARTKNIFEAFKPKYIPAIFSISYIFLIIMIWTAGNNDPVFTRFIFPVYPFFLMSAYAVFIDTKGDCMYQKTARYSLVLFSLIYIGNQFVEFSSMLAEPPS